MWVYYLGQKYAIIGWENNAKFFAVEKQRNIVMYHRNWCKKAVIALKNGEPVIPYRVFLSGPVSHT